MSHVVTATQVARRIFGLPRLITIVRCACGWHAEFDHPHTAATWTRHHREGRT